MTRFLATQPIAGSFVLSGNVTGETFTISNATKPGGAWAGPITMEMAHG